MPKESFGHCTLNLWLNKKREQGFPCSHEDLVLKFSPPSAVICRIVASFTIELLLAGVACGEHLPTIHDIDQFFTVEVFAAWWAFHSADSSVRWADQSSSPLTITTRSDPQSSITIFFYIFRYNVEYSTLLVEYSTLLVEYSTLSKSGVQCPKNLLAIVLWICD